MKRVCDIKREHQVNISNIDASLLDYRCYGQEKIKKPKVLKGLKSTKSFELLGKKVNVFEVADGSLVLYFGTLFSKLASFPDEEDMTLPTSALARKYNFNKGSYKNFIYPDAWCTIYNRNEGYVLVTGLTKCFEETYGIHIPSITDKLYLCLRDLSTKDVGFLRLGIEPIGADSADYYRLCSDIIEWLYKENRI